MLLVGRFHSSGRRYDHCASPIGHAQIQKACALPRWDLERGRYQHQRLANEGVDREGGNDGKLQLVYYEIGVNGFLGGTFGKDLDENIKNGYEWLIENYDEGDEIFIFGFSRGASAHSAVQANPCRLMAHWTCCPETLSVAFGAA